MKNPAAILLALCVAGCSNPEPVADKMHECSSDLECGEFEFCWSNGRKYDIDRPDDLWRACRSFSEFTWSFYSEMLTCEEEPEEQASQVFEDCEGGSLALFQEPGSEWSSADGRFASPTALYRFVFEDYDSESDNDLLFDESVSATALFGAWRSSLDGSVVLEQPSGHALVVQVD